MPFAAADGGAPHSLACGDGIARLPPALGPGRVTAPVEDIPAHIARLRATILRHLSAGCTRRFATRQHVGPVVEQRGYARAFAPDELEGSPRTKLLVAHIIGTRDLASAPRAAGSSVGKRRFRDVSSEVIDSVHARHLRSLVGRMRVASIHCAAIDVVEVLEAVRGRSLNAQPARLNDVLAHSRPWPVQVDQACPPPRLIRTLMRRAGATIDVMRAPRVDTKSSSCNEKHRSVAAA